MPRNTALFKGSNDKEKSYWTTKGPGGIAYLKNLDLSLVLAIINHPGEPIEQLATRLGISNDRTSRKTTELVRKGIIRKSRSGRNILLFPENKTPIIKSLEALRRACLDKPTIPIETLIRPSTRVRLIWVLISGPKSKDRIIEILDVHLAASIG